MSPSRSTSTPKRSHHRQGDLHVGRGDQVGDGDGEPFGGERADEQQGGEELGGQAGVQRDVPALDPVGADGERVVALLALVDEVDAELCAAPR